MGDSALTKLGSAELHLGQIPTERTTDAPAEVPSGWLAGRVTRAVHFQKESNPRSGGGRGSEKARVRKGR